MSDETIKTADWAPGTLDNTRKNIGDLSDVEAADMAKKLGGEIMYERSSNNTGSGSGNSNSNKNGRIMRNTTSSSSGSASKSSNAGIAPRSGKYKREQLPNISKKAAAAIDKLMMAPEYKIKPNYGLFNFIRSLQKNGTERINLDFYTYSMKQQMEHMEAFVTVVKTLIQIAPATYKAKIANGPEAKFKF